MILEDGGRERNWCRKGEERKGAGWVSEVIWERELVVLREGHALVVEVSTRLGRVGGHVPAVVLPHLFNVLDPQVVGLGVLPG